MIEKINSVSEILWDIPYELKIENPDQTKSRNMNQIFESEDQENMIE